MTLAHDVQGDGPPLLLVHGATLDRRMWAPNMAALTERHRVVRCDLRGFGASPPPAGPYSHADDLHELLGRWRSSARRSPGCRWAAASRSSSRSRMPEVVGALVLVDTDLPGVPLDAALREAMGVARGHVVDGDLDAAREAWLAMPFFARSPDRRRGRAARDRRRVHVLALEQPEPARLAGPAVRRDAERRSEPPRSSSGVSTSTSR